ncbi:MAG: SDR family NAD(P)-dependent oxidoreductase [Gammaproteobacteria bacterium]
MANWGPFALDGKVALVTGGAAGIGLGIVESLSAAGAQVMATGRRADGADILARHVPGAGWFQADLADPDAPDRIVAEAVRRHGRLDILVNNAAMLSNMPLADVTAQYVDAMVATNLRAVILLTRAFAAHCRARGGGGRIVNICSLEGYIATLPEGMAVYSATKSAIPGFTVTMARELGPLGIGVNGIVPGAVVHENLFAKAGIDPDRPPPAWLDENLARLRERTNVGRLGTPADIGHICVFLASEASAFVSGQLIHADGGGTRT